jgi:hypothetical protein
MDAAAAPSPVRHREIRRLIDDDIAHRKAWLQRTGQAGHHDPDAPAEIKVPSQAGAPRADHVQLDP